ncbi:CoA-binding protein [Solimonas sp. K1W22B-7]|uniref:CoA-binding protein n=1 Tax=Solimonas sp. K1W22B-7 TaxID=2303331 RepID=UPI000E32DCB7|nr:CoA-binding protein [Solimonas sp. K1W22B-7]AXQ30964.1 CoA-binding protein [Solimonas sp. K1W22B-7]
MNWQDHLLTTPAQIGGLLARLRRVAVLGMRSERYADRPAHYVPLALKEMGLEIVPVDLHEPELKTILGEPVYRRLADIPGPLDLVDVFRRPADVPGHLDEILAKRPAAVWLQTGIRHDAVAEQLAREGIDVVQDRCLMVEYRRYRSG